MNNHPIAIAFLFFTVFFGCQYATAQSQPVVAKAGLRYVNLTHDNSSQLMPGYFAEIDVRMGVLDNSYIIAGGGLGRQHNNYRADFLPDESLFKIKRGFEYARFNAGIEGRLRDGYHTINVRWHAKFAAQFILNDLSEDAETINDAIFVVPLGLGVDFGFVGVDFTIEPAISSWEGEQEEKPVMYSFSVGFQF